MNIHFTVIDIGFFAVLAISALLGIWRGLIREVFALIAWVAAAHIV